MVEVTAAVEVDQWLKSYLRGDVLLGLGGLVLLSGSVVAGDISLVVLGVMELHDLARDGWLECAIVV